MLRPQVVLVWLVIAATMLAKIAIGWAQSSDQQVARSEGLKHWVAVESVLTHPRCLNCHSISDYPRQADDRRPHRFRVLRGKDDKGAPGALCISCHQPQNSRDGGPPGAPGWHFAPRSMAWERSAGEAMASGQLCRTLLDRKKNGNRNVTALIAHLKTDKLVLWAWAPGTSPSGEPRSLPPLPHNQFVEAVRAWSQAGSPCPE